MVPLHLRGAVELVDPAVVVATAHAAVRLVAGEVRLDLVDEDHLRTALCVQRVRRRALRGVAHVAELADLAPDRVHVE